MALYPEIWGMDGREQSPGGACLNSIRACNFMLSDSKPNSTAFFGSIGKDEFGQVLEKELESKGIKSYLHKEETTPTGTCGVIVKDSERSLVANLSACLKYPTEHLK